MKLKKLIVVRHGDYCGLTLTEVGKRQINALTKSIGAILHGSKIIIVSSTASRAKETSSILAEGLGGLTFEECGGLYSYDNTLSSEQTEEVSKLIAERGEEYDAIILSTHMEFIDQFPTIWGEKNGFMISRGFDTAKGSARIIEVETGEVLHLQPMVVYGRY